MSIPKQIKDAIRKHKDAAWTVQHHKGEQYQDIYKANGKPVFVLTWWDRMSKPAWRVY